MDSIDLFVMPKFPIQANRAFAHSGDIRRGNTMVPEPMEAGLNYRFSQAFSSIGAVSADSFDFGTPFS